MNLKYDISSWKDIWIRTFEFVTKTHLLSCSVYFNIDICIMVPKQVWFKVDCEFTTVASIQPTPSKLNTVFSASIVNFNLFSLLFIYWVSHIYRRHFAFTYSEIYQITYLFTFPKIYLINISNMSEKQDKRIF